MTRIWKCGRFELGLDGPLVMGVLNVTPDSFSDGGEHVEVPDAIAWAHHLVAQGADIIDLGGESTRPGSDPISTTEEIERVRPVLSALVADGTAAVSIDTRHAEVASAGITEGADIVNDVSGFRDDTMVEAVASSKVGVVIMHMLGEPGTMQDAPYYDDVVDEIRGYLDRQAASLVHAGIEGSRIAIDPGIGFGKTFEHNLEILRRLPEFSELGYPVLVGASRKRFIGEATGIEAARDRLGGSIAAALWAASNGADIVRVHDVGDTVQALQVTEAVKGDI